MTLSPRVARLRAPNPSPMTLDGTNGYVVDGGDGHWAAIDPGPAITAHVDAFVAAARARGATYDAIVVTHGHPDHAPGAALLAAATGAPVYAHPDATFAHDRALGDGATVSVGDVALRALHAPGHAPDHLVVTLDAERALFTGDVVIGQGTVVIAPPAGDMRAYQRTLRRLRDDEGDAAVIYGGHGPERTDVRALLDGYIAHREARETALRGALSAGATTVAALVATLYPDLAPALHAAAAAQVRAYLIALEREGVVTTVPDGSLALRD